jgi:hypothetical protein
MDNPRTSSYSSYNGNCVEIGEYRKSSRSAGIGQCIEIGEIRGCRKPSYSMSNGNCTEIGEAAGGIGVRDTKQDGQANRTELRFSSVSWGTFLQRLKDTVR